MLWMIRIPSVTKHVPVERMKKQLPQLKKTQQEQWHYTFNLVLFVVFLIVGIVLLANLVYIYLKNHDTIISQRRRELICSITQQYINVINDRIHNLKHMCVCFGDVPNWWTCKNKGQIHLWYLYNSTNDN